MKAYFFLFFTLLLFSCEEKSETLPNILWIVSEDNSPFLGCYGDSLATSPHIDRLAQEGMMYNHAFSNAPVCAPARHTIITGTYANGNGTENMRSDYSIDSTIRFFPHYLREKGYYTTNKKKKDYNTIDQPTAWDESGRNAHYKNRAEEQPFFHIFNFTKSHESSIHGQRDELKHDPQQMKLPPYHPDTEEIRKDWAWYYDRVTQMDSLVGAVIDELKANGLYEETIIFYYSDHGGVLARSKRYLYESGQKVPFIVRVPEKYQHLFPDYNEQSTNNRLISFVDLAPTTLSLAGIAPPEYYDGLSFLKKEKQRDYVYGYSSRFDSKVDMSRSVRDGNLLYIRHFFPERPNGYKNEYQFRQATMNSWQDACENGLCDDIQAAFWKPKPEAELFDCAADPHNVHNLIDDPKFKVDKERLEEELKKWMIEEKDKGIVHELERLTLEERLAIDTWSDEEYRSLLDFAILVANNTPLSGEELLRYLDKNMHYQNWVLHFMIKNGIASSGQMQAKLSELVNSEAKSVEMKAAFLLLKSHKEIAERSIKRLLDSEEPMVRLYMMDILQYASLEDYKLFKDRVLEIMSSKDKKRYDVRIARYLEEVMNQKIKS